MNAPILNSRASAPAATAAKTKQPRLTLALIWVYFFLLMFEGSLRKWILPHYSNPLLIVRDPVAFAIYLTAWKEGVYPRTGYLTALYVIAAFSLLASVFVSHGSIWITLYGFHANFFHLPLIFILHRAVNRTNLQRLGYATMLLAVPMAVMMILQFQAPPDSPLNRGTLGVDSGQITSALGKIRPAGFFSYNTGATQYLSLLASFVVFGLLSKRYPNWLVYPAAGGILIATAVSGSRSMVTALFIVSVALIVIWIVKPKSTGRLPAVVTGVFIAFLFVQSFAVFHEGMEVLGTRTSSAFESETLWGRITYTFGLPLLSASLLGEGLGLGTNVGAALATGQVTFLLAENEWARIIQESGPILGLAFIFWRVALLGYLGVRAFSEVRKENFLSWLILTAAVPLLLLGNFGQASTLGFAVFVSGLCLAATNPSEEIPLEEPDPEPPAIVLRRGRSPYAESLHGHT